MIMLAVLRLILQHAIYKMHTFAGNSLLYIACLICFHGLFLSLADPIDDTDDIDYIDDIEDNVLVSGNASESTDVKKETIRSMNSDGRTEYCYLIPNNSFIPYWTDNSTKSRSPISLKEADRDESFPGDFPIGAPDCTKCHCGIRGFKVLLIGHVSRGDFDNVTRDIRNVWRELRGPDLSMSSTEDADLWTVHVLETEYGFHDPVYGNLTYLTYAVLLTGRSTREFSISDVTDTELVQHAANFTFAPCRDCRSLIAEFAYIGGLRFKNKNNNAAVVAALTDSWNEWNREVTTEGFLTIQANYTVSRGYNARIGNDVFPVRRVDYTVVLSPGISWSQLDHLDIPSLEVLNSQFRSKFSSGVIVYPSDFILSDKDFIVEPGGIIFDGR